MPARAGKVQSSLHINLTTRDRIDAIALVMPDSRAEVLRRAIELGLTSLENTYLGQMRSQLDPHADRFGMDRTEMAGRMTEWGLSLAEVAALHDFPGDAPTAR